MSRIEREKTKYDFLLHRGVDIDNMEKSEEGGSTEKEGPIFGDPKEYENMSDEEKTELTNKMKQKLSGLTGMLKSVGSVNRNA